jgi:hypothetical protein
VVLKEAQQTLKRVKYLEFENHEVGAWATQNLSYPIEELSRQGFLCYWAGKTRLWRITDCWLENFDFKAWSNVACVNMNFAESRQLAFRMEEIFLKQLNNSHR